MSVLYAINPKTKLVQKYNPLKNPTIPNNGDIADTDKPLDISIKIIECKMSVNVEGYYDEAFSQVSAA